MNQVKIHGVNGSICETGVDEIEHASLSFGKSFSAKIGAAIRLQMQNQTKIIGTKGNILINNPWLPDKKSVVEINFKERSYKSIINSKLDIFASQIDNVNKCILDSKEEVNFPGMTWKDSASNMLIIEKWKNKLFENYNEKN